VWFPRLSLDVLLLLEVVVVVVDVLVHIAVDHGAGGTGVQLRLHLLAGLLGLRRLLAPSGDRLGHRLAHVVVEVDERVGADHLAGRARELRTGGQVLLLAGQQVGALHGIAVDLRARRAGVRGGWSWLRPSRVLVLILQHLMLLLLLLVPLAPLLPILLLQLLTQLGVDEVAVVLVVLAAPLLLRLRLLLLQALVSLQQVLLALLGDRLHGGHVAGRGRGRVGGCPAPADGGVQEGVVLSPKNNLCAEQISHCHPYYRLMKLGNN